MQKITRFLAIAVFSGFLFVSQPVLAESYESDVGLTFEGYEPSREVPPNKELSTGGVALPETGDVAPSVMLLVFGVGLLVVGGFLLGRTRRRADD
ncbi:LPXTG cell wall anchor domain-containing protein [Listeria cornellensis]|uniref:Gram-positive cocci surface proteins LPxTG domain-containing protein n=1 Tax=Listeria cornellensis FSL F6-0969 TaxID=1265820 RepID=W7BE28_9LIST|nr:LPXTG cell wall anchor domain-containing protein [Listeria cornellensis]EUJ25364.1 hypothetical protein PCORN_17534 [Listeria cornellensis FSL F6-0969]